MRNVDPKTFFDPLTDTADGIRSNEARLTHSDSPSLDMSNAESLPDGWYNSDLETLFTEDIKQRRKRRNPIIIGKDPLYLCYLVL